MLCLVCLSLAPFEEAGAQASTTDALRRAGYVVYTGNINSDGVPDIMVKAKTKIVIIDFDPAIPLKLKPSSPTFVLLSTGANSYVLDAAPSNSTINSSAWSAASYQAVFGDFTGSGIEGMFLRDSSTGGASFSITLDSAGQPHLLQAISPSSLGTDLGAANNAAELRDINGDGRADLVVRTSGRVSNAFLAASDGTFVRDNMGSIYATWFGMLTSLDEQNSANALQYIAADEQPRYQDALANMGASMTTIRQSLSNFAAIEVNSDFATFVVDQTVNGQVRSHFVNFTFSGGQWKLATF